jgi:hypothetical protein
MVFLRLGNAHDLARIIAVEEIAAIHPPLVPVDLRDLADQMTVVADGSIIMQRALADPALLERQALLHRAMLRRLFTDE